MSDALTRVRKAVEGQLIYTQMTAEQMDAIDFADAGDPPLTVGDLRRVLAVATVPPCVIREVRALPLDMWTEAEMHEVDAWLEAHAALTTTTEGE